MESAGASPGGLIDEAVSDTQTVRPDGSRPAPRIEGVHFRPAVPQVDERGVLTEIFSLAWEEGAAPPHVYLVEALPGSVRGWVVHREQTDRLFFSDGIAKVGLFDARPGSPSEGVGELLYLGIHHPGLLTIPPGVFHGIRNVGTGILRFVNLPSAAYNHAHPDKHRLSPRHPAIPVDL